MKTGTHTLAEIVQPRRAKVSPSDYPELPYVGLEHVEAHTTRLLSTADAKQMKSTANLFEPGDVLYSRLRPYLNKVWRADRKGLCSSEFIVLPGNEKIDPDFLRYRLNANDFVSFTASLNAGDRPRVDFKQIAAFRTWLPNDLSAQRNIVAEIEKQFTRLDAGVAALRRVQANLKRYRAAVLKAACEGKLGAQNSASWTNCSLGDVLSDIESGKSFRCDERPPTKEEIGVIKVSAVTWGTYDETESKTCTDAARVNQKLLIRTDDFLFSRANTIDLVGACVIAKKVTLKTMLSDKILRFHFISSVLPAWALYWLRSDFGKKEIKRLATGNQESMRNIGQERIRQIEFKLPSLSEQKWMVSEVERRLSAIEQIESSLRHNIRRAASLRQAILKQAFGVNF